MTPEDLVRLLAEPHRLRAFAAVTLGATEHPDVAEAARLSPKETAAALQRLIAGGLLIDDGQGLRVPEDQLRTLARATAPRPDAAESAAEAGISQFVKDGKLLRLPARPARRQLVLEHITAQSFTPGVRLAEPELNEVLRAWCEGGESDHAAVRRHLVVAGLLMRENSVYWRP